MTQVRGLLGAVLLAAVLAGCGTIRMEGTTTVLSPNEAEQKVELKEGAPREVRFAFKASRPGTATFRFRVERGADRDGVQEKIPVELPVGLETVATYGDTQSTRDTMPPSKRGARASIAAAWHCVGSPIGWAPLSCSTRSIRPML